MSRKAFITGITGQDGSYLAEYLVGLGYEVYGITRRNSVPEHQSTRIQELQDSGKVTTMYGDMLDPSSLENALRKCQPDEIYNLAAQSHVRISSDIPHFTVQTNAVGTLNILEAYRRVCPRAKFYQASSSEMFGNSIEQKDGSQNENTPMHPVSPYGCAKLFAYHITRHYRNAYGLFACNGILFNHESPRRASNFVTSKIVKAAVMISKGRQNKLELGNMITNQMTL
jgi:GDPmannose 4,6-dehydratase